MTQELSHAPADSLTSKQRAFADAYRTNGGNGTQAALAAGYDVNNENTAHAIASENLRKPAIQAYLTAKLLPELARYDISADRIKRELARLGFSDVSDLIEWGMTDVEQSRHELTQPDSPNRTAVKLNYENDSDPPDEQAQESTPYARLRPSADLSPDVTAAISEVSVTTTYTRQGEARVTTRVKQHSKVEALVALAKVLKLIGSESGGGVTNNMTVKAGDDALKAVLAARKQLDAQEAARRTAPEVFEGSMRFVEDPDPEGKPETVLVPAQVKLADLEAS